MSRDWETHVYFEHRPLTVELIARLLDALAAEGLRLESPPGERFPALDGWSVLTDADASSEAVEQLLRAKEPPVGLGYGILPLAVERPELPAGYRAFLTFARPDLPTGLDGVTLATDGAVFLPDEPAAMAAAVRWLASLSRVLGAVYGWADWETATFLVAGPSRRDVRAGRLPRLMRLNEIGPALLAVLDTPSLTASSPRVQRLDDGTLVFERRVTSDE